MSGLAMVRRTWRNPSARDAVLMAGLTVILVLAAYGEAHPTNPRDVPHNYPIPYTPNAALLLVAAAGLVLIWRYRYPVAVLAASMAAVVAYSLLGYVNGAALLLPQFGLYAVALAVSAWRAAAAAAATLIALMAATAAGNPFGATGGGFFLIPAMVAAALFGGIAVKNRRAFVASIQERADDQARRQIDEERLRIARELHDVVAHTMSTINVQAAAASVILTERPEQAAEALQTIRTASKEGLRELRAILNVLRQADDADPTSPAPGLAQLPVLVEGAAKAGLPVTVRTTGEPAALPAAIDLAAYRIIQESLTNAIRHAGPAEATVSLGYAQDCLRIEVRDTGRGVPAGWPAGPGSPGELRRSGGSGGHGGHGLAGMRERAAAAGGELTAGPAGQGGGFALTAALPFRRDRPERAAGPSPAEAGAPGGVGSLSGQDGPA
ncbi:MAG TPA: sensor histidine kinase [Streptosporangiaceae bacterium]